MSFYKRSSSAFNFDWFYWSLRVCQMTTGTICPWAHHYVLVTVLTQNEESSNRMIHGICFAFFPLLSALVLLSVECLQAGANMDIIVWEDKDYSLQHVL